MKCNKPAPLAPRRPTVFPLSVWSGGRRSGRVGRRVGRRMTGVRVVIVLGV